MNPTDEQRAELLDQLFPAASAEGVEIDQILRRVGQERAAQSRVRQRSAFVAVAAVALLGASALLSIPWRRATTTSDNSSIAQVHQSAPPDVTEISRSSTIEKVDDDQLLGMMDDTPAALVEWPDGRRSLLVLVKNAAAN